MKIVSFLDLASLRYKELCEWLNANEVMNISCLKDKDLKGCFYKCEIASASFVLALLAKMLDEERFNELDEGYLSAECCLGEEEAIEILDFLKEADWIVFDANLKKHKDFENIAFFLHFLSSRLDVKLLCSDEFKNMQDYKPFTSDENISFKGLKELDNYDGAVVFNLDLKDDFIHCSKTFARILRADFGVKLRLKAADKSFESVLKEKDDLNLIAFLNFKAFDLEKNYDFLKLSLDKKA